MYIVILNPGEHAAIKGNIYMFVVRQHAHLNPAGPGLRELVLAVLLFLLLGITTYDQPWRITIDVGDCYGSLARRGPSS